MAEMPEDENFILVHDFMYLNPNFGLRSAFSTELA
jgi:hypothetical protein